MGLSRRWFLAGLAVVALAAPASARMHAPYRGHRIVPGGGALDGITASTPSGAYSFRKLKSTYAGPAIRIRRASDNAELDINFLGCTGFTGCPWDAAAATSHCASTSCSVVSWYDQSGNARDIVQATQANQPALAFSCVGSLPCVRATANAHQLLSVGALTPATGNATLNAVARRAAGPTVGCAFLQENGFNNRIATLAVSGTWAVVGTGNISKAAVTENVVHSAVGVINGASSNFYVDSNTPTTGSVTGILTAGSVGLIGGNSATCEEMELVVWDNYVMPPAEAGVLIANQRSFGWIP